MEHIAFPSIGQYRNVIHDVKHDVQKQVTDELTGEFRYDNSRALPKLRFTGTVKIHGTNAAVAHNPVAGLWAQSRTNIITPESDNYGFARFVAEREHAYLNIINQIRSVHSLTSGETVIVFGEWAGSSIQQNVAIAKIDRAFFIFAIQVIEQVIVIGFLALAIQISLSESIISLITQPIPWILILPIPNSRRMN